MENRRLSLGHKQIEENPWDVFETLFTVDSIHEGTIVEIFDKGALIALPYGVEGFCSPKQLMKEDGSLAKVDEKLEFKVVEFSKNAKRIVVSHSKVYEDSRKSVGDSAPAKEKEGRKAAKKPKTNMEKTTLGDISDLAALKEEMEQGSKKGKKADK